MSARKTRCGTRYKAKIKPLLTDLRDRLFALPSPGVLTIKPDEFRPSRKWFSDVSAESGMYFSLRTMDGGLVYVFRLK
jgi:hypothetical protein